MRLFVEKETKLEAKFVKRMDDCGYLALKLNVVGHRGYPDRVVVGKGRVAFVELKRKKAKPTALQLKVHEELRERGARVFVIDRREDFDEVEAYMGGYIK